MKSANIFIHQASKSWQQRAKTMKLKPHSKAYAEGCIHYFIGYIHALKDQGVDITELVLWMQTELKSDG